MCTYIMCVIGGGLSFERRDIAMNLHQVRRFLLLFIKCNSPRLGDENALLKVALPYDAFYLITIFFSTLYFVLFGVN